MHEFGIAENIFNALKEAKTQNDIKKIISVKIKAGALLHIVPETLKFAFENLVSGSEFECTKLEMNIEKNKIRCLKCGHDDEFTKDSISCKKCGSSELKLVGSKELVIESIETE